MAAGLRLGPVEMRVSVRTSERAVSTWAQERRRYLLTGGGTGGHVTPNIALIGEIRRRDPDAQFLYIGSARGYEAKVRELGIKLVNVPCAQSVSPRRPIRFLWMLAVTLAGAAKALLVMLWFRPSVVIATGGFVSVPAVLAAALLRRRIFLQEQNARLGAANRFLAQFAGRVGLTFRAVAARVRRAEGNPRRLSHSRSKIETGSPEAARERYGIPEGQKVVFVVGGSMGSRSINRGMVEALKTVLRDDRISVIHSTGLAATHDYHAYDDTCERLRQLGLSPDIRSPPAGSSTTSRTSTRSRTSSSRDRAPGRSWDSARSASPRC